MTTALTAGERDALYRLLDSYCGTPEGFRQHRQQHDVPCSDCNRAWLRSSGCNPVRRPVCGTNDGWLAHRRRWEHPCFRCIRARERHEAEKCGTYAGWMIHRRNGTAACDPCREACAVQHNRPWPPAREVRKPPRFRNDTVTGQLRNALDNGARVVSTAPGFLGLDVVYAPRAPREFRPWALACDLSVHLSARECRAVYPTERV